LVDVTQTTRNRRSFDQVAPALTGSAAGADSGFVKRTLTLILFAMLLLPSSAAAAPRGFLDEFDSLDAARWSVGEHHLGRSALTADNVTVDASTLRLALPAGTTDGGEVRTKALLSGGVVSARLRVADAPSSLTGFFLYAPPDYASEIDIEILNDAGGTVLLSTYANGRQTHTETRPLGFDPTADFHDYAIRWKNGTVNFTIDDALVRTWTSGVPKAPMALYANAWFPAWLEGLVPGESRASVFDAIEYDPR
jgi:beta-glucanase (GH16 family)